MNCVLPHCGQLTVMLADGITDIGTSWFAALGESFQPISEVPTFTEGSQAGPKDIETNRIGALCMYLDQSQKRAIPVKVRFEPVLDRILRKAAHKSRRQHATYLYELIEWAVANGAIEELQTDHEDIAG